MYSQFGAPKSPKAPWSSNLYTNIFTPRPYQIELLECAVKQNTIICVNTEGGKHFISTMLIREMMIKYEEDFDTKEKEFKLAVLLLNNDLLVAEQCEMLANHLHLDVMACTKDKCLEYSKNGWKSILSSFQVVTIMPELLLSILEEENSISQMIDLLIFDECHLICNPQHPHRKLMQILDENHCSPAILGLTMSLLYDDITAHELKKKIEMMEHLLHSKAETATDLIALDRHSLSCPTENIILSADKHKDADHRVDILSDAIRGTLTTALEWLNSCQIQSTSTFQVVDWELCALTQNGFPEAHNGIATNNEDKEASWPFLPDGCSSNNSAVSRAKLDANCVAKKDLPVGAVSEKGDTSSTLHCENSNGIVNSSKDISKSTPIASPKKETQPAHCDESFTKEAPLNIGSFFTTKISEVEQDDVCTIPKSLLEDVLEVLDILGPWCAYKLVDTELKQVNKALLSIERRLKYEMKVQDDEEPTCGRLIWQKLLYHYVASQMKIIYTLCHQCMGKKLIDLKFVSPKVHRLLQVLKEYQPANEPDQKQPHKYNDRSEADYVSWWQDSDAEEEEDEIADEKKDQKTSKEENFSSPFSNTLCGIVFVQKPNIAMMLQRLLRDISKEDSELKHVNSSHLGSQQNDHLSQSYDFVAAEKNKQEEVLRKFRCHETNLLVTTNGLEDCAYVPKCNLVVRFDVPRSYKAYAQSKSRARANTSAYIMLVREREKYEFMEKLQEYKHIEQVLQGPCTVDQEIQVDENNDECNDITPYFTPNKTSATMRNAIKIVNRYCSRLPSDPFTHLSPRCDVLEEQYDSYLDNQRMYRCTLQLPINSHLREPIRGVAMSSVVLAQQAVAVETCKRLHLCGELDDNLLPIGKETVKYAEELDPWKSEATSVPGRPGSTKRRQTYVKDVPHTLSYCLPDVDKDIFIYEIEMKIHSPLPAELNVRMRKIYFPEHTKRCFGLLTTRQIPQIPGTPIFTRSGEERARLRLCRSFVRFSPGQLRLIKCFHRYLFFDMLRVVRMPLSHKPECASMQILVVVLNKVPNSRYSADPNGLDIDWSFMMKTDAKRQTLEKMKKDLWFSHRMTERKKTFTFNRKLYEDGVVVAKYRSCDQPNRFYVAEIKDDLGPDSSFPSTEYQSFKQYYKVKYGLDIRCDKQPLLDVDHTSSRLNLLTPRYLNQKGKALPMSSFEKKRAKYESLHNRQILVPELCEVHPIPASLWRKAVCLPSILYRISQLLVAEELRQDIAVKSGIVSKFFPLDHKWPDINFGWNCGESPEIPPNLVNNFHVDSPASNSVTKVSPPPLSSIGQTNTLCDNSSLSLDKVVSKQPITANFSTDQLSTNSLKSDPQSTVGLPKNKQLRCDIYETNGSSVNDLSNDLEKLNFSPESENEHGLILQKSVNFTAKNNKDISPCSTKHEDPTTTTTTDNKKDNNTSSNITTNGHNYSLSETMHSEEEEEAITKFTQEIHKPSSIASNDVSRVVEELCKKVCEDEELLTNCDSSESDASFLSDDYELCFQSDDDKVDSRKRKMKRKKHLDCQHTSFGYNIPHSCLDSYKKSNPVFHSDTGPGPEVILQALTLSNASDGFNLERLEMLGDSFLKHAVTLYLYCTYPDAHEGKLSYMRSKKVSNYNLYRIGRAFGLAGKMTAHIFDPTVNWMPPGFIVGSSGQLDSDDDFSDDDVEIGVWTDSVAKKEQNPPRRQEQRAPSNQNNAASERYEEEDEEEIFEEEEIRMIDGLLGGVVQSAAENARRSGMDKGGNGKIGIDFSQVVSGQQFMHFTDRAALKQSAAINNANKNFVIDTWAPVDLKGKPICSSDPLMLDLHTQHSLADKSIADSVEALLGAYLTACGHRAAQLLLCHLGLTVLPKITSANECSKTVDLYGYLTAPSNDFSSQLDNSVKVRQLLLGLKGFEKKINYTFKNKAYLLQAFTHASYYYNTATDCYQRLEFLGDAVLDFLITRHLFNDGREHSPGALTDLRSALVNNTIFASLAVRYDYHKYFKAISPELQKIIEDFVSYQQKQEEAQGMDAHLMRHYEENVTSSDVVSTSFSNMEEEEETEDVEVPKALGDIFESVAGAIFMDSGMDLRAVWDVYSVMMMPLIEKFSSCVPRSPVRELLEMEPETAKFSCAEKRYDGKIRVTVEIIGKGRFKGVGRSYRIAKSAAARRALRFLKGYY